MKLRILPVTKLLIVAGLCTTTAVKADYITLAVTNGSAAFAVPSNVLAKVVHVFGEANLAIINVTVRDLTVTYPSIQREQFWVESNSSSQAVFDNIHANPNLPIVTGPATITLSNSAPSVALCTIKTEPATSINIPVVQSNAVVIPNDNGGPVTIILESSVDLVNWNAALPGTYGTTATNRFFRVRAQR